MTSILIFNALLLMWCSGAAAAHTIARRTDGYHWHAEAFLVILLSLAAAACMFVGLTR